MQAQFRYVSGSLAGQVRTVAQEFATIGRHPSSDLPFDPEKDLDVSSRHAAVFRHGSVFVLRDLGSTNGTYVNGARIQGDQTLTPNDTIRFGVKGPEVVFSLADGPTPETDQGLRATLQQIPVTVEHRSPGPSGRVDTGVRIRAEVARQTAHWRWITLGLLVALGGTAGGFAWDAHRKTVALEAERQRLLGQVDSMLQRLQATSSGAATLQAELEKAKAETGKIRGAINSEELDHERIRALDRQLHNALGQSGAIIRAATFNPSVIAKANADAIVLVSTEFEDRHALSGTGFTVRSLGDTAWIVTSKHLLYDSSGTRARRLGVIFNGSAQHFRAEIDSVHTRADLALLRVHLRGGAPVVQNLGSSPETGEAIASIGFPLGLDLAMGGDWRKVGISATTNTGTVTRVLPELLQYDGYGAEGLSGSPVFNAQGDIVGVVFGGLKNSNGRVVYAVPVSAVKELLGKREQGK